MAELLEDVIARIRQNKATRDVALALEIMCEQRAHERATIPSIDVRASSVDVYALASRIAALENTDESPLSMHQRISALEEHKPADVASIDRRLRALEPCPATRIGDAHPWGGDHGKTCTACGLVRD